MSIYCTFREDVGEGESVVQEKPPGSGRGLEWYNDFYIRVTTCNFSFRGNVKENIAMEYFYSLQRWVSDSRLYQEVLRQMPPPCNNVYFDTVLAVLLCIYLLYRVISAIRMLHYRRKIRVKQKMKDRERDIRKQELESRERQLAEREELMGKVWSMIGALSCRFLQSSGKDRVNAVQQRKALGIGMKAGEKNAYDIAMEQNERERMQMEEVCRQQVLQEEKACEQMDLLDSQMQRTVQAYEVAEIVEGGTNAALEKRKAKARRQKEREQRKKISGRGGVWWKN